MKYSEERDASAEKYSAQMFKDNPNGFHIAPWVNRETLADAHSNGHDHCLTQSSVVRGLVEIAELIKTGTPESGLDIYIHTKTIDALKAYSAACAEIEREK